MNQRPPDGSPLVLPPNAEALLSRFEAAWRSDLPPELEAFLLASVAGHPTQGTSRRAVREELVKIDLEQRWRRAGPRTKDLAGPQSERVLPDRPLLEDYVAHYPGLGPLDLISVELIGEEYWVRHCWGDHPHQAEYLDRFPTQAARLPEHLARLDVELADTPSGKGTGVDSQLGRTPAQISRRSAAAGGSAAGSNGLPELPGYEILGELGRGGMGVVYRARQVGLKRLVALKMVLSGAQASPEELARFEAEAEAVARLRHPHIVQIHDVGECEGRPYFALEYMDGGSLAQQLDGKPLPAQPSAELVQTLARAVHAAHQAGIIHRDLKPANILLASRGRETSEVSKTSEVWRLPLTHYTPKVADFGLAKQLDVDASRTHTGAIVGTPQYMAPEQALGKGKGSGIGPATDVYALGALLYELLTGRSPFRGETVMDTLAMVTTQEPVPPSRLVPRMPRDLETVCLKCLEKEPRKRYSSAEELANDLERFLGDQPVQARPVGRAERFWRWCRRNPVVAALTGVAALALLAVTLVSTLLALEANQRERDAVDAAERTRTEKERADANAKAADASAAAADASARQARWRAYVSDMQRIGFEWDAAHVDSLRALLDGQRPGRTAGEDLRGPEWHFWDHLCHGEAFTFRGHAAAEVTNVAFSPDGQRLVSVGNHFTVPHPSSNELKIWEVRTGRVLRELPGSGQMALSPDGRWLAAMRVDDRSEQTLAVWDAVSGQEMLPLKYPGLQYAYTIAFSPDGKLLAARSGSDRAVIWERTTGNLLRVLEGHLDRVRCLVFRPDGTELATASNDGTVRLWNVASGRCTRILKAMDDAFPWGVVWGVAYSPDGKSLAACGDDRTVKVWDAATGSQRFTFRAHTATVCCLAFSPNGRWLASAGADHTVRIWDAQLGGQLGCLRGHTGAIKGIAFSADGHWLATAAADQTVRVWESITSPAALRLGPAEGFGRVFHQYTSSFSRDGRRIALATGDGTVRVQDAVSGAEVLAVKVAGPMQYITLAYSPDGRFLATVLWDPKSPRDPKASRAAQVWDAETGRQLATGPTHARDLIGVVFSPDSQWLATWNWMSQPSKKDPRVSPIQIWSSADGRVRCAFGAGEEVTAAAFSPDGRLLATGGGTAETFVGRMDDPHPVRIRLWDAGTGRAIRSFPAHSRSIWSLAFSPDGKQLASTSEDRTIKLWEVATGKELFTLAGHSGGVERVQFSPDGKRLGSGAFNTARSIDWPIGETILWDLPSGQPVLVFDELFQGFSPDGQRMLTIRDMSASLWELAPLSADHRREQEAVRLFRYHREKLWLKEDIVRALRQDATASAPVRQRALALAERYREVPLRLDAESWKKVRDPKAGTDGYQLALRQAETAHRLDPANADYLLTLAAAYYRAGRAAEAVQTLTQGKVQPTGRPETLAFLALAQHQLGQPEAHGTLNCLLEAMNQPAAYQDREARDLVAETRASILGVQTHALDPVTWHVVGPFDGAADKDVGLEREFPPETAANLAGTYPGKSGPVVWQQVRIDAEGYVDLVPVIQDNVKVVAYAYCEVEASADHEATVFLGTDDSARLWVNGSVVYTNPRRRPYELTPKRRRAVRDEDRVVVPLRKGHNAFLLKITNYDAAYGFYFRLESPHELKESR